MLTIGIDPHKQTHSGVAVDPLGVQIAQRTVAARREGFGQLLEWARKRRSSSAAVRDAVLAIRRADGVAAFALDLDRRWASPVAESAGGRFDRAEVRLGSARVMGRTLVAVGSRRLLSAVAV
jgi:hypothetical protein